ncbi:unnamed protein product, partial [marine sediment metagenome]
TFSRDMQAANGDAVITGVGFKPSHVIFLAGKNTDYHWSAGFDDGSIKYSIANAASATVVIYADSSFSIKLMESSSVHQKGLISAIGSDGFTITWTRTGSPAAGGAVVYALCLR